MFAVLILLAAGLACGIWLLGDKRSSDEDGNSPLARQQAFNQWLEADLSQAPRFAAFEAYLHDRGVGEVVPVWQLAQVDAQFAERCDLDPFAIPPEEQWPNIVPALQLVKDEVIPAVGPVEVLSSFRSQAINTCARGASRSKHLSFAALDLATVPRRRDPGLFRELCAMQRASGPESRMGLGAYFNPAAPDSASGRFHIDAEGYRTWGHDYSMASNPCSLLLGA